MTKHGNATADKRTTKVAKKRSRGGGKTGSSVRSGGRATKTRASTGGTCKGAKAVPGLSCGGILQAGLGRAGATYRKAVGPALQLLGRTNAKGPFVDSFGHRLRKMQITDDAAASDTVLEWYRTRYPVLGDPPVSIRYMSGAQGGIAMAWKAQLKNGLLNMHMLADGKPITRTAVLKFVRGERPRGTRAEPHGSGDRVLRNVRNRMRDVRNDMNGILDSCDGN